MSKDRIISEGCFDETSRRIANRNFSDVALASAQVDVTSSTALVDATGLATDAFSLAPGTYRFDIDLLTAAGGTGGIKIGLKQNNGLTFSSLNSAAKGFTSAAVATQLSTSTTDQAALFTQAAAVINCEIDGTFVVATAGTLQLQVAQNTSNATPASILLGSRMAITRVGA